MNRYPFILKHAFYLFVLVSGLACNAQGKSKNSIPDEASNEPIFNRNSAQIGAYVVAVFEDSKSNLWFGTLELGVAKHDGEKLTYLTTADGLPSNRVTSVIEDKDGNLWFGTGAGLAKYDGETFTIFAEQDGLCNNSISDLLIDRRGTFWIGTWGGVCTFDGTTFTKFPLPTPAVNTPLNEFTENWITDITEDSKGAIWFGRDSYGACKYDGETFTNYLKKDGLYSNCVHAITEDQQGTMWFGARVAEKDDPDESKRFGKGGVTTYDGTSFDHFPTIEGLNDNDVYEIYQDDLGNTWISTISNGLYKYDGATFINYKVPKAITNILKDRNGTIWLGCAGGLFRLDGDKVVNVTVAGPF